MSPWRLKFEPRSFYMGCVADSGDGTGFSPCFPALNCYFTAIPYSLMHYLRDGQRYQLEARTTQTMSHPNTKITITLREYMLKQRHA
jgi:hypothetical protein